jgi:hypothetical protein
MLKSKIIATAIAAGALVALPAAANAAPGSWIGSELDPTVQPSNSAPAHDCDANPGGKCSWVMGEAYGNPGGEAATKSGYLRKVKLVAGEPGSFKLQVVKTRADGSSRLVRQGPRISYQGQSQQNWDDDVYRVEKFKTHLKIKKGQRLAIKTRSTSMLRCSSGGANTLQYSPPLKRKQGYRAYDNGEGCWMLIEGKVK